MLAVCISIAGVILIGYSEGFGSFGVIGILLAAASAICSAFYRVSILHSVGFTVNNITIILNHKILHKS